MKPYAGYNDDNDPTGYIRIEAQSSQYTPTTEEVRDAYIESYACTASWNGEELWGAEFDRWLAEHDREQREIAWDEGVADGQWNELHKYQTTREQIENPYRKS